MNIWFTNRNKERLITLLTLFPTEYFPWLPIMVSEYKSKEDARKSGLFFLQIGVGGGDWGLPTLVMGGGGYRKGGGGRITLLGEGIPKVVTIQPELVSILL